MFLLNVCIPLFLCFITYLFVFITKTIFAAYYDFVMTCARDCAVAVKLN